MRKSNMSDFKTTELLQDLKKKYKHTKAKLNIGHNIPTQEIHDLKSRIISLEQKLFANNNKPS